MTVKITIDTKLMDKIINTIGSETITPRTIHDGVEYGIYQEFTKSGHPSLIPAWEQVTGKLLQAIGQAVESGVSVDAVITKAAFDVQTLWAGDVNIDTGAYKNSIKVSDG